MSLAETARRLFTKEKPAETAAAIAAKLPDLQARLADAKNELAALEAQTTAGNAAAILEGLPLKRTRDLEDARENVAALACAIDALQVQHTQAVEAARTVDVRNKAAELNNLRKALMTRAIAGLASIIAGMRELGQCGIGPQEATSLAHQTAAPILFLQDLPEFREKLSELYALGANDSDLRDLCPGFHAASERAHQLHLLVPEIRSVVEKQALTAQRAISKSSGIDLDAEIKAEQEREAMMKAKQADEEVARQFARQRWTDALKEFATSAAFKEIMDDQQYLTVYNAAMDLTAFGLAIPAGLMKSLRDYGDKKQAGERAPNRRDRKLLAEALNLPLIPSVAS